MKKPMKEPTNKPYIDLGDFNSCIKCRNRYCICRERQDGTWENHLPIYCLPGYKEPTKKEWQRVKFETDKNMAKEFDYKNHKFTIKEPTDKKEFMEWTECEDAQRHLKKCKKCREKQKEKLMFISHAEFCRKKGKQFKKCCKCILEEL